MRALLRSINALKDTILLTLFCVSVFALIGYQLFNETLRQKLILNPCDFRLAPLFNTLLLGGADAAVVARLLRYNIDRTTELLDERHQSLWFQLTRENGDILKNVDDAPQEVFGWQHDTLRWKRSDGAIIDSIVAGVPESFAAGGTRALNVTVEGGWRESALVKISGIFRPGAFDVPLECTCESDDRRCRYIRDGCAYKLNGTCWYGLDGGKSSGPSNGTCPANVDGSRAAMRGYASENCWNSSTPRCKIRAVVKYHRCEFNATDGPSSLPELCRARHVRAPEVTARELDDFAESLLQVMYNNETLRDELNVTRDAVANFTKEGNPLMWSPDESLADVLGIPARGMESLRAKRNCSVSALFNATRDYESKLKIFGNVSLEVVMNTSRDGLLRFKRFTDSGVDWYKRSDAWLRGVVVQFKLATVDDSSVAVESPEDPYFLLYLAHDYEVGLDRWKELRANQAEQEPVMGLNFHPGAVDRHKKDYQYCIMDR